MRNFQVTVANVGRDSLQGDAHFHELLEKMGCDVSQTATSTTVKGPSQASGLKAVEVDMDTMTGLQHLSTLPSHGRQ